MTEKIINCGNCLFCAELSWGFLQCKISGEYVGNVGERITAEVKDVKLVTSWETVYGWTHLYKFTTIDNNVLVWYASKCIDENLKKITGTIKDHSEYDGEKQTVLTRCKAVM